MIRSAGRSRDVLLLPPMGLLYLPRTLILLPRALLLAFVKGDKVGRFANLQHLHVRGERRGL